MRRFVGDASHELRTPLTSIRGFAELYRHGGLREATDVARAMGRIEDESMRMQGLVEDLLLLARLDEQRPLARERVNLDAVVADAVADARAVAPDRAIAVVRPAGAEPAGGRLVVLGDDARLRQVLANLLANALAHTPPGSPVQLRAGVRGGRARVEVVDHGPGLSAEQAARVFDRFYRTDSARSRSSGGAGLGLSIAAALVAAHDGRVGVAPTAGGGATFWVELVAGRFPGTSQPGRRTVPGQRSKVVTEQVPDRRGVNPWPAGSPPSPPPPPPSSSPAGWLSRSSPTRRPPRRRPLPAASASPSPGPGAARQQRRQQARAQRQQELAKLLAAQLGVDQDKVSSALTTVREQLQAQRRAERLSGLSDRLDAAVKAGTLSRAQADAILAAAKAGVLPGGRGGHGGHGRHRHGAGAPGVPGGQPAPAPSASGTVYRTA